MPAQTTYLDAPALGFAGSLDYKRPNATLTMKNTEASASIPFAKGVKRKASATTDYDATFPSAQADRILGIVVRNNTYARTWTDESGVVMGQLDAVGLVPGTLMTVATTGRMLVTAAAAVTAGAGLFVRCVAGGGKVVGDLEAAADGINTVDCSTQGRWETSASAGGLAWLSFNFTNI